MTAAYDWTPEISNLSNELTGLKMPPPTPAAEHHIRSLRTSFDSTSARGMPVDESSGSSTEAYVFLSILAVLLLSAIVCAEFMSRRSNHRSEEQKEEEEERENEDRQKMVDSLESRKVTLKVTQANFKSTKMIQTDGDTSSSGSSDMSYSEEHDIESRGLPESPDEASVVRIDMDNDIQQEDKAANEVSEHLLLVLPRKQQNDTVPNDCAICLESYKVGDSVAWSCNKNCPHAFHQHCLVSYLVKVKDYGTPCPMCRQNFLEEGTEEGAEEPG